MIVSWIVVLACLVSEAFFALTELSIISANPLLLEEKARAGDRAAAGVRAFRAQPARLFATTLLGTNLSVVTGSTVASLAMMRWFPETGEWIAMAFMSPLVLIGGEIIPKTVAQRRASTVSLRLVGSLRVFSLLFSPLVWIIDRYAGVLYRVLGLDEQNRALASREELVLVMEHSGEDSELEEGEREMISRIFSFSDLRARGSMIPLVEVCAVSEAASVRDAAAMMAESGHSRLPVYRERIDDIVGVLHHLDLLRADDGDRPVGEIMTPPQFVPETQEIDDLLVILQRKAASVAIVVDEFGGAVGLLTLEDILEEIVGEIDDEFDEGARLWRPSADGGYLIAGRASVQHLNEEFSLDLPEDGDYETVAGYVLDRLRRIPHVGESVKAPDGQQLLVVRASARAIEEVKLAPPHSPSAVPLASDTMQPPTADETPAR